MLAEIRNPGHITGCESSIWASFNQLVDLLLPSGHELGSEKCCSYRAQLSEGLTCPVGVSCLDTLCVFYPLFFCLFASLSNTDSHTHKHSQSPSNRERRIHNTNIQSQQSILLPAHILNVIFVHGKNIFKVIFRFVISNIELSCNLLCTKMPGGLNEGVVQSASTLCELLTSFWISDDWILWVDQTVSFQI